MFKVSFLCHFSTKNQQARPGGLQHLVGQLPTTPSMAKSFDGLGIDAYL